jgi:type IX secretion system substrate protein
MKKYLIIILFLLLQTRANVFAQLQNSGWKSPASTHAPNGWTNPQNAYASDDVYTTVAHQSGCRCPFMDLSWDNGTNYTSYNLFGPYGTSDSFDIEGDSTDGWGHAWIASELSDPVFVLRIWNPSTLIRQGYSAFQFGIPGGSSISGIEVRVEEHGDSNYVQEFVDVIQARVYYYLPNAVNEIYSNSNLVNVYPNPANDFIHLRFGHEEAKLQLQIVTLSGQLIHEKRLEGVIAGSDYKMDICHLSPGIYFINIISDQRIINTRILKE